MKELAFPLCLLFFFVLRVIVDRITKGKWDFSP